MGKELEGAKDRKAITDWSVTSKATEKKKGKTVHQWGHILCKVYQEILNS